MRETPGHRFVEAAFKGDLELMRNLVEKQHVDPNTALVRFGMSVLLHSINVVNYQYPTHQDEEGEFAIHLAASAGHIHVLEYLIEEIGQEVDMTDNEGITPLLTAAWHGHIVGWGGGTVGFFNNFPSPLHLS